MRRTRDELLMALATLITHVKNYKEAKADMRTPVGNLQMQKYRAIMDNAEEGIMETIERIDSIIGYTSQEQSL